jgi:FkbM family methyltransferase
VPPLRWLVFKARLVRAYVGSFGIAGGAKVGIELLSTGRATLQLAGEPVAVRVRRPGSDISVFHQVFVYREYDDPCLPADARLVVDAGANVGYASLFFAARYASATVVAIEPEQENFEALVRNVRDNPRIEPVRAALWPTRGTVGIANPEARAWAFQVTAETDGDVEALGVPDLLARFVSPNGSIDVLKIDIEGAEKELFEAGVDGWIDRVGTLVLETHDRLRPGCSDAVSNALSGRPYRRYEKGENLFFVPR